MRHALFVYDNMRVTSTARRRRRAEDEERNDFDATFPHTGRAGDGTTRPRGRPGDVPSFAGGGLARWP